MKAITVRQPWASAIIHRGKDIENRSWRTNYRGPLLIHAALRRPDYDWWPRGVPRFDDEDLVLGAIIGLVDLVDVVESSRSRWYGDEIGFVLRNPRALRQPIPCKGALNLWNVPANTERRIRKELGL